MAKQTINIGASPNDGTGTPLRTSFDYTNQNFTELYTALGGGVGLPGATTQVIFNDGGTNLAGDAGLVYNKTTDALTVAGLVTAGSATITGDLTVDASTLKVDSTNDRVGIGTASPATALDVNGDITQRNGSGTIIGNIQNSAGLYDVKASANVTGLQLSTAAATPIVFALNNVEAMRLNATGLGVGGVPSGTNRFLIFNGATQALTLDTSGNLLVGTTTNTNGSRVFARGTGGATTLAIQSSTGDTANPGLLIGKFDNDSTTSQILVRFTINNNSGGSGQINANGASQAAFGSYSDSRLKENIVNLPSQLASVLSLRPVEFDYKDGSGHQIGFVAQEMQEVYSDAVGEQNGFLTVTGWSKTEARLVSAIKELAARVQTLETR